MKMKERIVSILIIVYFAISLCGCAKCISTETSEVQVVIKDANYKSASSIVIYNPGLKMSMVQPVPAQYKVTVEYNDCEYKFTGKDTYSKCKDKVGETVIGVLEIKKYDNGRVVNNIIEIK